MMELPLHLQTLYAELLQQLLMAPGEVGSVYIQTAGGARYAYLRRTTGVVRRDTYIGPETEPGTQARIAEIKHSQSLARQRRKIVSLLKHAGLPGPSTMIGRVLDALADAQLFRESVLIGTGAYQCYSAVTGYRLPSAALTTQDADIATASLAIAAAEAQDTMLAILQRADPTFRPIPGLKPADPPSAFASANGFMVDLVTPQLRRTDRNPMPLPALSAGAAPLQHLKWLIEEPVTAAAVHGAGVLIKLPQPARFAVHKLILAQKRGAHEHAKRTKDLRQAGALIDVLQRSNPAALEDAMADAESQGRTGWKEPLRRSLRELKQ